MSSFEIFNPWKFPNKEDQLEYGFPEILALSEQFTDTMASSGICLEEWDDYRQFLKMSVNLTKQSEVNWYVLGGDLQCEWE